MDIEEIRELIQLMVENDLSELDVSDGENKIKLRRGPSGEVAMVTPAGPVAAPAAAQAAQAPAAEAVSAEAVENIVDIKSPMVGTFYVASSPDMDAFVAVGSTVNDETVVCIVEAMKVMNEIKAECSGQIVEICVNNVQPVEYGQVLFRVKVS